MAHVRPRHLAIGNLQCYSHLELSTGAPSESNGLLFCITTEYIVDFIERYKDVFDEKGQKYSPSSQVASNPAAEILRSTSLSIDAEINSIDSQLNCCNENQDLLLKLKVDTLLILLVTEFVEYKKYLFMSSKATDDYARNRLQALLLDHVYSDTPICKIAEKGGYSPTAFKKQVKAQLGLPPRQWINKVRLQRSVQLLKDRTNSIAFVSHEVGFESQSYFSVIFKREFGMSPKDYQKMSK